MKVIATIAAGGLLGLASLWGSSVARADSAREQQACQLMDDPAGPQMGYTPAEYAFMQLRATMSAQGARDVMSQAAQDLLPESHRRLAG